MLRKGEEVMADGDTTPPRGWPLPNAAAGGDHAEEEPAMPVRMMMEGWVKFRIVGEAILRESIACMGSSFCSSGPERFPAISLLTSPAGGLGADSPASKRANKAANGKNIQQSLHGMQC